MSNQLLPNAGFQTAASTLRLHQLSLEDAGVRIPERVPWGSGYQMEDPLIELDGWLAAVGERAAELIGSPTEGAADAVCEASLRVRELLEELMR